MSLSRGIPSDDTQVRKLQERIREQETRLRRMVLQGVPTQAADDLLGRLRETLRQMKTHRRPKWR